MKKKYFIIFLLFIKLNIVQSKPFKSVPGFRNNRNTISLGLRSYIPMNDLTISNMLQVSKEITYDRVLNRRSTVSFSIGQQNYKIRSSQTLRNFLDLDNRLFVNDFGDEVQIVYPLGEIEFSNVHFNISKTFFISNFGAIAPYGKYFKMGITNYFLKIKKDNMTYRTNNFSNKTYKNPDNDFVTKSLMALNFELGSKVFFYKNMFFNKSVSFNFPLNFWSEGKYNTYTNMSTFHETYLKRYVSGMQTININLALGFAF